MKTRGKDRNPKEVVYGALTELDFDTITVGASQASTTVQARFPLGLDFKCLRVAVVPGAGIANLTSFNIVVGEAAEGALSADDVSDYGDKGGQYVFNSTSGTKMFNADKAVTNTAGLTQTFTPDVPEAIYQQGTEMTLRIVSAAGGAGTLKVVMYGRFIDTKPTRPMSAANPAAFNPATDL